MKEAFLVLLLLCNFFESSARSLHVGETKPFPTIKSALLSAQNGDTLFIHPGLYKEGNIVINKSVSLIGIDLPVIDGDHKSEVLTIKADYVSVSGLKIQHSSYATLEDPGGIKIRECKHVTIINNQLLDNFFGIYVEFSRNCFIKNNTIIAHSTAEQEIGNGIHAWKSDSLLIIGNKVRGNRDGIYLEFVTNSVIWRNISTNNLRYGLHFMFSHNDSYISNYFRNNGAGVAVMFTHDLVMMNNTFEDNWGDAAYGLLLKEISDCTLVGNRFVKNTSAIFMDGTNRITVEKNLFQANGWGMKIQANCMDNSINQNNFMANTFDISTNGTLTLNNFDGNYWDKYEGYDLDRNGIGDVPFHPLSLYSVIVEGNPPAMLLFRSFMVTLLDRSEKMLPSLTPENFVDNKPRMRPFAL
ncbi:MAG TPA: nitrous oxide reductase family maturation protein NosD [Bacteroidetes bacterium]|nr:nitrous oxide reductase family maturation protein NosD [Bacteroidota bacterium]